MNTDFEHSIRTIILRAGQNEALFYQPVRVSVRLRPNTPQKPGANALRLIPRYQPRKVYVGAASKHDKLEAYPTSVNRFTRIVA